MHKYTYDIGTNAELTPDQASTVSQATVKSLTKLEEQRKLLNQLILESGGTIQKDDDNDTNDDITTSTSTSSPLTPPHLQKSIPSKSSIIQPSTHPIHPHKPTIFFESDRNNRVGSKRHTPYLIPINYQKLNFPLLVIIRHGKTEHNKLGLFTGWEG